MSDNSDNIDELLEQLKNDTSLTHSASTTAVKNNISITDDNINEYILNKASRLVEGGVDTIDVLRETVLAASTEPHEIEAYSELFKAVTGAIDVLNKVNIQNKKTKASKEIKEMEITARKELPENKGNTNILIATREEIIKGFLKDNKENLIDADFKESDEEEDEK